MLVTLGVVVASAAAILAGLGALPERLAGESREARRVASLDEAEKRLGARLMVPAYFPDRLDWPPAEVRVAGGQGGSAMAALRERGGGRDPVMVLLQASSAGEPIAGALLRDRRVLGTRRTVIGAIPATVSDVIVDGVAWQELSWEVWGRAVLLRTRGSLDEAYRMARSVRGRR